MENNKNYSMIDKSDELIDSRDEQKKLVHPYRKYQLYILFSLIITIIFISILFRQNKKLQEYLTQKDIAFATLQNIDIQSKGLKTYLDLMYVNYNLIKNLDSEKNIHVLKKPSDIYFLSSLIADENEVSYELCYKSSIDGDSPKIFFDKCLSSSPLVFLIETYQGYRFGVYISVFLGDNLNEDKYIRDDNAFIFSLNTFKKYKIIQKDFAIYFRKDKFPWFGKKDIYIGENFEQSGNSFCEYPLAFERNKDDKGEYILNGGIKKFGIKELEILTPFIWAK